MLGYSGTQNTIDKPNSYTVDSTSANNTTLNDHPQTYNYRVGQKSKSPFDLAINRIKTRWQSYFFVNKLSVEQATEVNANKHLLVLKTQSVRYSMHDVKCVLWATVYFATTDASEYLLLRTVKYLLLEAAQSCKQLDIRCCRSWVGVHAK